MKKILAILFLSLIFTACSKDESIEPQMDATVREIWQTLNGKYTGEYTTSGVSYKTEEITFSPYSEPKEITPIVMLFSKFTAYGTAYIKTKQVSTESEGSYYYSINVAYSGAVPTISFYEYTPDSGEVKNKEDKRNIRLVDASVKMWKYGLTEDGSGNAVVFTKK